MSRETILAQYKAYLEEVQAFGPVEVANIYKHMLELLEGKASKDDLYHDYRYESYRHPPYSAKLWESFIEDILQMDDEEERG